MELSNPYFIENIMQDQPYSSMLLIAPKCDFSCVNCHNKHLKGTSKIFDNDFIVGEYKRNPFYKGITIGGLEMFLSGDSFIEDLLYILNNTETENFTFYTRFSTKDYKVLSFINRINKISTLKNIYVKTGKYIEGMSKKNIKIGSWKLELASDNQDFTRLK